MADTMVKTVNGEEITLTRICDTDVWVDDMSEYSGASFSGHCEIIRTDLEIDSVVENSVLIDCQITSSSITNCALTECQIKYSNLVDMTLENVYFNKQVVMRHAISENYMSFDVIGIGLITVYKNINNEFEVGVNTTSKFYSIDEFMSFSVNSVRKLISSAVELIKAKEECCY